jgi:hypothetical protein
MNVKPGQIARLVQAPDAELPLDFTNKLVHVEALVGFPRCCAGHIIQHAIDLLRFGPLWETTWLQSFTAAGETFQSGEPVVLPDRNLRPLYDGDEEDEVLRTIGKPVNNTTPSKEKLNVTD